MLWVLLAALSLLVLSTVAVLVTPVELAFAARTSPRWRLQIAVRLLGGLTPAIPVHDSARPPKKAEQAKEKKEETPKAKTTASRRAARVAAGAPQLAFGLLKPIRLTQLRVDADIGLADPADTGQLCGLLAAVTYARPPNPDISIAIRPDFTGPRASGGLDTVLSFVPVAFIPPGVRFAWQVFGARG